MAGFADLKGKRAIVTGACGVIGRWIVEALRDAGCSLCLTDARAADLDQLATHLGLDKQSFARAAELTSEGSIHELLEDVDRRWGAADILVNNAGVYPSGFLLDIDVGEFDRIFSINLRAPFILTRGVALQMI